MAKVKVSKRFTVNMGNFESYSPEYSVELDTDTFNDGTPHKDIQHVLAAAIKFVDETAYADLSEAAELTNVRDSYILTWLHNREGDYI